MEVQQLLKKLIVSYPIIYGGTMMATLIYCLVFEPNTSFGLDYFCWMLLFALAGDLPSVLFYSRRELTRRQWNVRTLIHFIVLVLVLLFFAKKLELYHTFQQGLFFAGLVLAVYLIVMFACFAGDRAQANKINERLKAMKNKN